MTESRLPMTNDLVTGYPLCPARILRRLSGILPVAMIAALIVLPAHASPYRPTQPGAPVVYLAQAGSDTGQSAGEDAKPEEEPAVEDADDDVKPAEKPAAAASEEPAAAASEEPQIEEPPFEGIAGYPPILRSEAAMPPAVRKTWAALREVARLGDIEALRPLIEAQPSPPTFAFDEIDQPILYLKSLSGDPEGREILAILLEVLQSGFVLADPDSPQAMYLWPYFARYPLEELSPEQMVEMFTLLTAGDYQDMLSYGAYFFFRVGIGPDGTWHFFVAGD